MWSALSTLLAGAFRAMSQRQIDKSETRRHEQEIECARQKDTRKQLSEGKRRAWAADQFFLQNAGGKRDLSFGLALIPLVLAFFPPTQAAVLEGFAVLETLPAWYRWGLAMMFISIWGLRGFLAERRDKRLQALIESEDSK